VRQNRNGEIRNFFPPKEEGLRLLSLITARMSSSVQQLYELLQHTGTANTIMAILIFLTLTNCALKISPSSYIQRALWKEMSSIKLKWPTARPYQHWFDPF